MLTALRGEVQKMPLTVTGKVQGQHSTSVDVPHWVAIAQKALATVEVDGRIELQIRCVHVTRRSRVAGVYTVGYEVHVPNSVELLLFDDAASGHPATLVAYEQHRLSAVLKCLSPRHYEAWQESRRIYGLSSTFVQPDDGRGGKAEKLIKRGAARGSSGDVVKGMLSSLRSLLKHQGGFKAKELAQLGKVEQLTDHAVCRLFMGGRDEDWDVCFIVTIQALEQYGFIELPAGYRFDKSTPVPVCLTAVCYDYAQAWIDTQNAEFAAEWTKEKARRQQDVYKAEHKLRELNAEVAKQRSEVERHQLALEAHQQTKPDQVPPVL